MITITGGHGDFRGRSEVPRGLGGPLTPMDLLNASQLADSPDEVRLRTSEQLLLGASQIKLTAGGGVASPHSPLDASTVNEDELRAAVQAAAGVKVIEHDSSPARPFDDPSPYAGCCARRAQRPCHAICDRMSHAATELRDPV